MSITDTHTHLYVEAFNKDRSEVVNRAIACGITRFFLPAIDENYTASMLDLQCQYPDNIFVMSGLHPTSVQSNWESGVAHVAEQLSSKIDYCAVGEIGIDLYWDKTLLEEQKQAFVAQIRLAKTHNLPIVIHCREAFDDIFKILDQENDSNLRGIFHCFTGNIQQAQRCIDYNMMLGIGGVVTFKNGGLDKFLHQIDLSHIVLETDSPYLTPTPHRGKRNESSYILEVIKKISEIYHLPEDKVIHQTTLNSINIFQR